MTQLPTQYENIGNSGMVIIAAKLSIENAVLLEFANLTIYTLSVNVKFSEYFKTAIFENTSKDRPSLQALNLHIRNLHTKSYSKQ